MNAKPVSSISRYRRRIALYGSLLLVVAATAAILVILPDTHAMQRRSIMRATKL